MCWDINKRENNALIVELKSKGGDAYGYDLDVSDMAQVHKIAAQVSGTLFGMRYLYSQKSNFSGNSFNRRQTLTISSHPSLSILTPLSVRLSVRTY